jgi:hypothetical protein
MLDGAKGIPVRREMAWEEQAVQLGLTDLQSMSKLQRHGAPDPSLGDVFD